MNSVSFIKKNLFVFAITLMTCIGTLSATIYYFKTGDFFLSGLGRYEGGMVSHPISTIAILIMNTFSIFCAYLSYKIIKEFMNNKKNK